MKVDCSTALFITHQYIIDINKQVATPTAHNSFHANNYIIIINVIFMIITARILNYACCVIY